MLPTLLPDMTLYSLCACTHRMSDRSSAADTSSVLFGDPRAGLLQDFPYALGNFCANTKGMYGTALDIVNMTTTLPYFIRFRSGVAASKLIDGLIEASGGRFKLDLGLHSSPVGAKFPLRACDQCINEDILEYGRAYWHRRHQLPGVWACTHHSRPLRYSTFRMDRRRKSCYILPADAEVLAGLPISGLNDMNLETILRFANISATLLDIPLPSEYSPERVRNAYFHGLKAQGLLTKQGRVRIQEFTRFLSNRFSTIAGIPPFDWIFSERHVDGFMRLVRKPRCDFHTTYHVLMIDALFGSWEHFSKVYEWEAAITPAPDFNSPQHDAPKIETIPNPQVAFVAALVRDEGRSLSSICRECGVDYQTVLRQVAATGSLNIIRRPKVLIAELRTSVVNSLCEGLPLSDIAATHGLSRATIDRICVETTGLHSVWKQARFERVRALERQKMLQFLSKYTNISLANVRKAGNNGYSWLSRHDADWLKSAIPPYTPLRSYPSHTGRRIDWEARDEECLKALRSSESNIRFGPGERLTPGALIRKLPRLSFTPRLDRLPRSKALIMKLLAKQTEISMYGEKAS